MADAGEDTQDLELSDLGRYSLIAGLRHVIQLLEAGEQPPPFLNEIVDEIEAELKAVREGPNNGE